MIGRCIAIAMTQAHRHALVAAYLTANEVRHLRNIWTIYTAADGDAWTISIQQ